MILIVGEREDNMTDRVCSYLDAYNNPYVRLNKLESKDIIDYILFDKGKVEIALLINGHKYFIQDFKSIWFRRGRLDITASSMEDIEFETDVRQHFIREKATLLNYIYDYVLSNNQIRKLNNPLIYNVNKLQALSCAMECGLVVPPTIVTNKALLEDVFPFDNLINGNTYRFK